MKVLYFCFAELLKLNPAPNNGTTGSLAYMMSKLSPIVLAASSQLSGCEKPVKPHVDETCSECHVRLALEYLCCSNA